MVAVPIATEINHDNPLYEFNSAEKTVLFQVYRALLLYYYMNNRKYPRMYPLNETAFDITQTPEQAYWLGFLMADGNVSKHTLQVEIHSRDKGHLEKLSLFMKSTSPIKDTRKECCRIRFNSMLLVSELVKYGLVPNKTATTFTPDIPKHLLSHFYRGIFDGDGWITHRNRYNSTICSKHTWEIGYSSGSKTFIQEIHKWLCSQLDRECGYLIHRKRNNNQQVYQLTFGGNKLFPKIIEILYNDATVSLDRKSAEIKSALLEIQTSNKQEPTKTNQFHIQL